MRHVRDHRGPTKRRGRTDAGDASLLGNIAVRERTNTALDLTDKDREELAGERICEFDADPAGTREEAAVGGVLAVPTVTAPVASLKGRGNQPQPQPQRDPQPKPTPPERPQPRAARNAFWNDDLGKSAATDALRAAHSPCRLRR